MLLNAGHSPQSLARQMVRYLRNTLMAKLGGEQTELLQISADERARAARTALLFTEEELTRNLQIMLRTFDDLNYRQEQRFHLELGLLKLVHAQRLLPLEELLSGVASGTPVRSGGSAAPRTPPAPAAAHRRRMVRIIVTVRSSAPPRSPFGSGPVMQSAPVVESHAVSGSVALAGTAHGNCAGGDGDSISCCFSAAQWNCRIGAGERACQRCPNPKLRPRRQPVPRSRPPGRLNADEVQQAIVSALAQQGTRSASQLISTARFTLEATSLRIEVPGIGKKMLALTVNAAAEKIIKQELQRLGAPGRFMVIPGEGVAPLQQSQRRGGQRSAGRARASHGAAGKGDLSSRSPQRG